MPFYFFAFFEVSSEDSAEKGLHIFAPLNLTVRTEGEQKVRNYMAVTLNKVTDENIREACWK